MFRKFFQALADLINSVRNLSSTFTEVDMMVREKTGLPPRDEDNKEQQLEHRQEVPKIKKRNTLDNEEET